MPGMTGFVKINHLLLLSDALSLFWPSCYHIKKCTEHFTKCTANTCIQKILIDKSHFLATKIISANWRLYALWISSAQTVYVSALHSICSIYHRYLVVEARQRLLVRVKLPKNVFVNMRFDMCFAFVVMYHMLHYIGVHFSEL